MVPKKPLAKKRKIEKLEELGVCLILKFKYF